MIIKNCSQCGNNYEIDEFNFCPNCGSELQESCINCELKDMQISNLNSLLGSVYYFLTLLSSVTHCQEAFRKEIIEDIKNNFSEDYRKAVSRGKKKRPEDCKLSELIEGRAKQLQSLLFAKYIKPNAISVTLLLKELKEAN